MPSQNPSTYKIHQTYITETYEALVLSSDRDAKGMETFHLSLVDLDDASPFKNNSMNPDKYFKVHQLFQFSCNEVKRFEARKIFARGRNYEMHHQLHVFMLFGV